MSHLCLHWVWPGVTDLPHLAWRFIYARIMENAHFHVTCWTILLPSRVIWWAACKLKVVSIHFHVMCAKRLFPGRVFQGSSFIVKGGLKQQLHTRSGACLFSRISNALLKLLCKIKNIQVYASYILQTTNTSCTKLITLLKNGINFFHFPEAMAITFIYINIMYTNIRSRQSPF
jgi:hypothetical protein